MLLELEWVMSGFHELPARDVSRVFRALVSIEHITLEDHDAVLVALDAFDKGLDFADALHLARSARTSGFATLDHQLAKRAKAITLTPPVELLGQSNLGAVGFPNGQRVRRSGQGLPHLIGTDGKDGTNAADEEGLHLRQLAGVHA